MSTRFDIVSPRARKNSDKPYWHRVGTAFEGDKGLTLVFDSLPLPDAEGRVAVKLFEQRPRDGAGRQSNDQSRSQQSSGSDYAADLDDDIPF
jgi:hypothetical protein